MTLFHNTLFLRCFVSFNFAVMLEHQAVWPSVPLSSLFQCSSRTCALGLHQGSGPSHFLPLYTVYLNYRWRYLSHLKGSDSCHKDEEYESLRG